MNEPPPCDDEHNTLSAWAWDYFEHHNFLLINEKWGWARHHFAQMVNMGDTLGF
jgi:hypothetical protein